MSILQIDIEQVDPIACPSTDPHLDLLELSRWGRQMVRELEAFLSGALAEVDISPAESKKQSLKPRYEAIPVTSQAIHAEYEPC